MALTPVQRQDKNGYLVTRWVKAEEEVTNALSIPPVALPVPLPFDRVAYISEILGYWEEHAIEGYDEDEIARVLWELENETLLAIDRVYATDDGSGSSTPLIFEWVGAYGEKNETALRELMTYTEAFRHTTPIGFIEESVLAIRSWEEIPEADDYSQIDRALEESIIAILKVNDAAYSDQYLQPRDQSVPLMIPQELRSFIMLMPDKADRISEVVTERQTVDPDLVRSIITSESPAVSEGLL